MFINFQFSTSIPMKLLRCVLEEMSVSKYVMSDSTVSNPIDCFANKVNEAKWVVYVHETFKDYSHATHVLDYRASAFLGLSFRLLCCMCSFKHLVGHP